MSGILRTNVELRDPNTLIPYENNHNRHSQQQIAKLGLAIAEHGFDQPIVVDKHGVIIKGHGRHQAALAMGLKQVPVIVAADLTPEQVKSARIADNIIATEADIDLDLIREELEALNAVGYNLAFTGFNPDELDSLLADLPAIDYQPPEWQPPSKGDRPENETGREPNRAVGDGPEERFLLSLFLTWEQYQTWKQAKDAAGVKDDKAMLMQILESYL